MSFASRDLRVKGSSVAFDNITVDERLLLQACSVIKVRELMRTTWHCMIEDPKVSPFTDGGLPLTMKIECDNGALRKAVMTKRVYRVLPVCRS